MRTLVTIVGGLVVGGLAFPKRLPICRPVQRVRAVGGHRVQRRLRRRDHA